MLHRIGIDIGTGVGLLALTLSKHCSMVYATDNYEDAVENAKFNVKKNLKDASIRVFHGDLFADIPQLAKESITLIVFNHPFYPSPLNLYNNGAYDAGGPHYQQISPRSIWICRKWRGYSNAILYCCSPS